MIIASIDDYRKQCEARLPRFLYDYISGGSYQENSLRATIADLQSTLLRQRVMVDESHLNLSTHLWDQALSLPIVLGPVGMAGMYSSRGEVKAANAAKAVGVPFTLSTVAVPQRRGAVIQLQHSPGKRIEHAFIEAPPQQADESASILAFDFGREVNVRAQLAVVPLELYVARCAQIVRVDANQTKDLLRGRPKVQNIARRFDLRVSFVEPDFKAYTVQRQCRGHAARPCADDRNAPPSPS